MTTGLWAAILSILAALITAWVSHRGDVAARSSPEQRAKDDKEKMEQAVANGDCNTINDMFNELHKDRDTAGDNGGRKPDLQVPR